MTFNSLGYLLFLPVVVGVYYLIPIKWRWAWLLPASYFAYMCWNPALSLLILFTTVTSWIGARMIAGTSDPRHRRGWLLFAAISSLGTLIYFKYTGFLLDNAAAVTSLFGFRWDPVSVNIILPAGISFYTFQTLSYVIDVYRGRITPETHFGYYALYVSFFPQLVAGPIERPERLLPQLRTSRRLNADDLRAGFLLMLSGYFKKCVVADTCAIYVNRVFADCASASGLTLILAGCLFVVEVYCDFAGYSEIAMGSARLMGIRLMRNFDRPFSATSIRDLMRRWHISLNTWFRDYVYIPLGGSRCGAWKRFCNVMIVYFLCGLWHGANWTYVCWGLSVALLLTVEGCLRPGYHALCDRLSIDNSHRWIRTGRQVLSFLAFVPPALFFRAASLQEIGVIAERIVYAFGTPQNVMTQMNILPREILLLASMFLCLRYLPDFEAADAPRHTGTLVGRTCTCGLLLLTILLVCLMQSGSGQSTAFVYFQF